LGQSLSRFDNANARVKPEGPAPMIPMRKIFFSSFIFMCRIGIVNMLNYCTGGVNFNAVAQPWEWKDCEANESVTDNA
jgi:hypothetical protein